jgi:hypothetical protein
VAFPGAYKASDPGITVDAYKGVWNNCLGVILSADLCVSASVYDSRTGEVHLLRAGGDMIREMGTCWGFF